MTIDPQPNEVIIPGQNVSQAQMLALLTDLVGTIESFQDVTTVVYVSEAAMNADLTPAADTLAITADSLKTWAKTGGSGTGSWSLNSNALSALQTLVGSDDGDGDLFTRAAALENRRTVMVSCQDADGASSADLAVSVNGNDVPVRSDGIALTEVAGEASLAAAFPNGWASIGAHDPTADAVHAVVVGTPWTSAWIDADPEGSFAVLYSPGVVVQTWGFAGRPTIQVEKGWGSGTVQDLYQDPDGYLWTGPRATGSRADIWAGSDRLFINRFYNQRAADTATLVASAISDDLRCLLDLTIAHAPTIAGLSTGTQDGNQSATARGYSMPVPLVETALHSVFVVAASVAGETWHPVQDDAGGTTRRWQVDTNSLARHFLNYGIAVGHIPDPTMPQLLLQWARDNASFPLPGNVQRLSATWGDVTIAVEDTALSGTEYGMMMLGPLNPLKGRAWVFGATTADLPLAQMRFAGLPARLAPLVARHLAPDAFSIAFPQKGDVIPMDVATRRVDIPIDLVGRPDVAYEARFDGGDWELIGRADRRGVLRGALADQGMELGDLEVRERGSVSVRTVENVGIGLVIVGCGESGADGRGDNVTFTDTDYILLNKAAVTTANRWIMLIGEVAHAYWAGSARCPTGFFFNAQGSTWMVPRPGQAAVDGHWNAANDGSTALQRRVQTQIGQLVAANADVFPARIRIIEDLGLNDSAVGVANMTMTTDWQTHAKAKRQAWRDAVHADLNVHHIVSLAAASVATASLDRVRAGQVALWDLADAFGSAGSQADLDAPTDETGVHLWTHAEKLDAAQRAFRCAILEERAPRYAGGATDGADVAITLTGGTGPMTISAPGDVAGWTVTDDNGARTVASVAVSGLVVTHTCDQVLAGDVSLQWCSGDTGVGTTLKDSHTIPLPPEPFGPVSVA